MSRIAAIVGRPNVGKSTLFNRLTESRAAIEDPTSGVTRDRHYGRVEWNGENFTLIDTGGYVHGSEDVFEASIRKQVQLAIDEADIIIFVLDVLEGITGSDELVADMLRKSKKTHKEQKILVVGNKADTHDRAHMSSEFYSLGLGDVYPISAVSGSGTGELLDELITIFKNEKDEHYPEGLPRIAVVGRPNVGKSSFINALTGEERTIVTDIAGTTRDAIDPALYKIRIRYSFGRYCRITKEKQRKRRYRVLFCFAQCARHRKLRRMCFNFRCPIWL